MDRVILGKAPGIYIDSPGIAVTGLGGTVIIVWKSDDIFDEVPSSGTLHYTYNNVFYSHTYSGKTDGGELGYFTLSNLSPATTVQISNADPNAGINYPISILPSETTFSNTYHRSGESGLFISKPGANVMSCSDADLLFDSTSDDFFQLLGSGTAFVGTAKDNQTANESPVYTGITVPHANNGTVFVSWNVLLPSTNLHNAAYSSSWNNSKNESYVICSIPFVNLDYSTLGSPHATGFVPGASLTARTTANTTYHPTLANTVDLFFKNGSPNHSHYIQWSLFREKGNG
jgi:hypothetical protein